LNAPYIGINSSQSGNYEAYIVGTQEATRITCGTTDCSPASYSYDVGLYEAGQLLYTARLYAGLRDHCIGY